MDVILLACLCTCIACGYADAKESDDCFRTGKAVELNFIIRALFGPKPSLVKMMIFNGAYQGLVILPWAITQSVAAAWFAIVALAFRSAQHLTQAYWGFCLNAGRPTPRVDTWWQKFFWQHSNVEE